MKTISIRNISEQLNVSERVVQLAAKELFPDFIKNGVKAYFDEAQVTDIKLKLQSHHNLEGRFELTTETEMSQMTLKVLQYHAAKVAQLKTENKRLHQDNENLKPKALSYDTFINNNTSQKIGDVAKLFNIKPNTLHKMFYDAKIMQRNHTPYAEYSHMFETKETPTKCGFNVFTSYITSKGIDYISKRFNFVKVS